MVRIVWVVLHKGLRSRNRWLSVEPEEQFRLLICLLIIICDSLNFMSYHIGKQLLIIIEMQTDKTDRQTRKVFTSHLYKQDESDIKLLTRNAKSEL